MVTKESLWKRLRREFPGWKLESATLKAAFEARTPGGIRFSAGPFDNEEDLCDYLHMRGDTILLEDEFNRSRT